MRTKLRLAHNKQARYAIVGVFGDSLLWVAHNKQARYAIVGVFGDSLLWVMGGVCSGQASHRVQSRQW